MRISPPVEKRVKTENPWRVIVHWTAGASYPNAVDYLHYHYLLDRTGKRYRGRYSPEDNINCYDGAYAAHTKGANGYAIGVSMCGMAGATGPKQLGKFPLTTAQWVEGVRLTAELCQKYKITPSLQTILGHCEVQNLLGVKQDGKWDPWVVFPEWRMYLGLATTPRQIGDVFRDSVKAFLKTLEGR